jgi:hypothetical protein
VLNTAGLVGSDAERRSSFRLGPSVRGTLDVAIGFIPS